MLFRSTFHSFNIAIHSLSDILEGRDVGTPVAHPVQAPLNRQYPPDMARFLDEQENIYQDHMRTLHPLLSIDPDADTSSTSDFIPDVLLTDSSNSGESDIADQTHDLDSEMEDLAEEAHAAAARSL